VIEEKPLVASPARQPQSEPQRGEALLADTAVAKKSLLYELVPVRPCTKNS
jgi:hypothetical protein